MKHLTKIFALAGLFIAIPTTSTAAPGPVIDQWASLVLDFGTEWSSPSSGDNYHATQVLGISDTLTYGDAPTAWAPSAPDIGPDFITVGFNTPVFAESATIRETLNNGFVTQVDVLDTSDILHTVWSGTDTSTPGTAADFMVSWAATSFLVDGLKIYIDTNLAAGYEEIDSIQLRGATLSAVPVPAAFPLMLSALAGLGVMGYRKKK